MSKINNYIYVNKNDLEWINKDLNLGESTHIKVSLYPHRDHAPDYIKFYLPKETGNSDPQLTKLEDCDSRQGDE